MLHFGATLYSSFDVLSLILPRNGNICSLVVVPIGDLWSTNFAIGSTRRKVTETTFQSWAQVGICEARSTQSKHREYFHLVSHHASKLFVFFRLGYSRRDRAAVCKEVGRNIYVGWSMQSFYRPKVKTRVTGMRSCSDASLLHMKGAWFPSYTGCTRFFIFSHIIVIFPRRLCMKKYYWWLRVRQEGTRTEVVSTNRK